jgi:hypothetical protein
MPNEAVRTYERERKRQWRAGNDSKSLKRPNLPVGTVQALTDIKGPKEGLRIAVIPDVQAMPGVPLDHLVWCGKYLADKQPHVIVCIGDFGDFPSLSHFDRGTLQFEGRRYKKDLSAFRQAMELLMGPINRKRARLGWWPACEFTMGNHEDHIRRAVNEDPKLEGLMSDDDLGLADYGWRVHEFLQPISIGGVAFCHYFPSGIMGRPITTAQALLTKLHMSAFAGHQQDRQIAYGKRADGAGMTAIISGSFYQHSYNYLSPFTNRHWRGMYMLHEVKDGEFDEMAVSISFLKRRYG